MVKDKDGGAAVFGHAAEVEEDRTDAVDGIFVPAAHDATEGIDDDEARTALEGAVGELIRVFLGAQVMSSETDVVQWSIDTGVVRVEDAVEERPETVEADFFVYV